MRSSVRDSRKIFIISGTLFLDLQLADTKKRGVFSYRPFRCTRLSQYLSSPNEQLKIPRKDILPMYMPLARTLHYIIYTTGSINKTVPAQVGYSCFALDLIFEFARFYAAKEQSVKVTPFMYMHPTRPASARIDKIMASGPDYISICIHFLGDDSAKLENICIQTK